MTHSSELEDSLKALHFDARRRQLEFITLEHLALTLIQKNKLIAEMLAECSADSQKIKWHLGKIVQQQEMAQYSHHAPQPSTAYEDTLRRAYQLAQRLCSRREPPVANSIHVIIAILDEPNSIVARHLKKYGVDRLFVLAYLANFNENHKKGRHTSPIDEKDWVAMAAENRLPLAVEREAEVSALVQILCHKFKNNPLLIGKPGVGKTTLVQLLAHRIARQQVPPMLQNGKIIAINIADIIAGTKYRGDLEQRVKKLIEKYYGQKNCLLFFDEIHTLIGTGSTTGSTMDLANILKPYLNDPALRFIGATTTSEYRKHFEKDAAFNRRFCQLTVREPDNNTLQIIVGEATHALQQHYQLDYPDDATTIAIDAAKQYLPFQSFPDKAIDILDSIGAQQVNEQEGEGTVITKQQIIDRARQMAGLRCHPNLQQSHYLAELEFDLCQAVFDQDAAAKQLANSVITNQLGYRLDDKVAGAFLFVGPTGVGKTEMTKQLAGKMALPLLRYDMSEYMERHAVSRLIGAPPGYVGFEQSGKLIEDVHQHPNSVILFDEVEKAHPDVWNILLQIFDYGTLKDNNGNAVEFRHAIVVLTSNCGSVEMARGNSGFGREEQAAIGDEVIKNTFSPEFRNRLDGIIHFQPLSPNTIKKIVGGQLATIRDNLKKQQNLHISFSPAFRQSLVQDGYSIDMGARPLKRLLQQRIFEKLAIATVRQEITSGQTIQFDMVDKKVVLVPKFKKSAAKTRAVATAN